MNRNEKKTEKDNEKNKETKGDINKGKEIN